MYVTNALNQKMKTQLQFFKHFKLQRYYLYLLEDTIQDLQGIIKWAFLHKLLQPF